MDNKRPTWAEINLAAIRHNISIIKKNTNSNIMAVVKANAYGHGVNEVSNLCVEEGISYFGLATLDEALHLRSIGISLPILVFGYIPEEYIGLVIEHNINVTVYNLKFAQLLSQEAIQYGKEVTVHIKIDTGMGRLGFNAGLESISEIIEISKLPGIKCEGIYTHFAAADQTDKTFSWQQIADFNHLITEIGKYGLDFTIKHLANSAATLEFPVSHLDMVRAGIILYGLNPSAEVFNSELIPALKLKSKITFIKDVAAETTIGYGRTYECKIAKKIATVPIGYADGYSRILSNKAWGMVRGQKAPLVGNVCMDQCMFDVSNIEGVQEGDIVTLIGSKKDGVTADDLADIMGTINYEVVSSIGARVPRIYI